MALYINGLAIPGSVVSGTIPSVMNSPAVNVALGGRANDFSQKWDGKLDAVMIFNNALSPVEVYALVPEPSALALLGLGLGSIQFIPLYEVASRNFRVGSVTYTAVIGWALPARRIISFLIPDFFGNPSHHTYFAVVTRQWLPIGLNAFGQVNPLCPYCTGWDTKTSVEAGAYVGILPLLLSVMAIWGWAADRIADKRMEPLPPSAHPPSHPLPSSAYPPSHPLMQKGGMLK